MPDNDTFSDAELLRYSRQILLPDWDLTAQLKLKHARVLMIGMGGLGCPAAQILVRAGLGYLRIVDFDCVEESNLQRQLLFHAADIGKPKVIAAKNSLSKINAWTKIEPIVERVSPANLVDLLHNIDLVLDGSDNFTTRDQINQACVRAAIPLLSAAAIGIEGQLSLFMPQQGCYRCIFPDAPEDARRCADTGVLASTTATIGAMQAHAALLYLGLGQTPLAGRLLLWDGFSFNQRLIRYQADPTCPICAPC
ncbi:MAG: HesA/MoeB/ThiF family protein [Pseudomonadota bacterium]|nr:HesA/MoeB/ThiF family protein [Pseudomonadota bacterium]